MPPHFQVLGKHPENVTLWSKLPTREVVNARSFSCFPAPSPSLPEAQGKAITTRGQQRPPVGPQKTTETWVGGGNLAQPPALGPGGPPSCQWIKGPLDKCSATRSFLFFKFYYNLFIEKQPCSRR